MGSSNTGAKLAEEGAMEGESTFGEVYDDWAVSAILFCDSSGPPALVALWRRASEDRASLELLARQSEKLRDARLFEGVLETASKYLKIRHRARVPRARAASGTRRTSTREVGRDRSRCRRRGAGRG